MDGGGEMSKLCESCGLWSRPGEEVHAAKCEMARPCPSCASKDFVIKELEGIILKLRKRLQEDK